jgi:hypothetical protein
MPEPACIDFRVFWRSPVTHWVLSVIHAALLCTHAMLLLFMRRPFALPLQPRPSPNKP